MNKRNNFVPAHFGDDLIIEILLRLPAKSILRFRAVCKGWRSITTDPSFLAKYALHQPLKVILYTSLYESDSTGDNINITLDTMAVSSNKKVADNGSLACYPKIVWEFSGPLATIPPSTSEECRRRLERYPNLQRFCSQRYYLLLASCDGLLLFRKSVGQYLICNPATRQWTSLPQLTRAKCTYDAESGFYLHQPSGEYRLMCHCEASDRASCYYILSTGAAAPRRVNVKAAPLRNKLVSYLNHAVLRGRLHWLRHPEVGSTGNMVAFDTLSETFHQMQAPPTISENAKLFDMDGLLVAVDFKEMSFDFWALEDYRVGRWEHRHRAMAPWASLAPEMRFLFTAAVCSEEGDVVLAGTFGIVAYNMENETVRIVQDVLSNHTNVSRHVFRESLVRHTFFQVHPSPGLPLLRYSTR